MPFIQGLLVFFSLLLRLRSWEIFARQTGDLLIRELIIGATVEVLVSASGKFPRYLDALVARVV